MHLRGEDEEQRELKPGEQCVDTVGNVDIGVVDHIAIRVPQHRHQERGQNHAEGQLLGAARANHIGHGRQRRGGEDQRRDARQQAHPGDTLERMVLAVQVDRAEEAQQDKVFSVQPPSVVCEHMEPKQVE